MSRYPSVPGLSPKEEVDSYSQLVSAPGPYLEFGEFLYLEASSKDANATLRLSGKFLSADGEIRAFSEDLDITSSGNQTAVSSRVGPCWIMGFSVRVVSGTVTDGHISASVHVARAGASTPVQVMTLASGEVADNRSLGMGAFFGFPTKSLVLKPTDPAAGSELSYTVPGGVAGFVGQVQFRMVLSATVASRDPVFKIARGAQVVYYKTISTGWAANQKGSFVISPYGEFFSVLISANDFYETYRLTPPWIQAGDTISTITNNWQAGDQYSGILIAVTQQF